MTMTAAEISDQVARADAFAVRLRNAISEGVAAIDPASACADEARAGLARISATLDAVPYVTICNLANIDAATHGMVMSMVEVYLLATGAGPSLDYASATAFLAPFMDIVEKARKRMRN